MRTDNLQDLRAFLAVARERSFTQSNRQTPCVSSALSHTIRGLEERLSGTANPEQFGRFQRGPD
jgi:DNA-binding transcriptional LysR family regulator